MCCPPTIVVDQSLASCKSWSVYQELAYIPAEPMMKRANCINNRGQQA